MDLNDDIVYRCLRLGPLHQRHPGRSRSLVRHHDRLHGRPPWVEFLPFLDWVQGVPMISRDHVPSVVRPLLRPHV